MILLRKIYILLGLLGFLTSCSVSKTGYPRKIRKESTPSHDYRADLGNQHFSGKLSTDRNATPIGVSYEYDGSAAARKANSIIDYAKSFLGTRYRYGGMSSNGMDCSGLVHLSFLNAADIDLPRQSREIAKKGIRISRKKLRRGDLVFFRTQGALRINHLGIVVEHGENGVRFIHASRSRGVMISGLSESYWQKSYQESRRVLLRGS